MLRSTLRLGRLHNRHRDRFEMTELTIDIMRRRWPHGDQHIPGLIEGIVASAPVVSSKYGAATSPLAIAHFMAQASEECGQGLEMIENMNYSAERLLEVFPRHLLPQWRSAPRTIRA